MESPDDYGLHVFNMLPSSVQSRMAAMPARLKSLDSLRKSVIASAPLNMPQVQLRRSKTTSSVSTKTSSSSSSSFTASSLVESDSASSSESTATSSGTESIATTRQSSSTSLRSISERNAASEYFGSYLPETPALGHQCQHLQPSLLGTTLEMEHAHQLRAAQLQMQWQAARQPDLRLPPNFNASSHDIANRKWSPSGIKWRYARQGAELATQASNELHDAAFERSSFIDALAYYLRACPDQLNDSETAVLARAAPWLTQHPHPEPQIAISRPTDRGKTFLYHGVQYAVAALIVLLHALWCFVLFVGRVGARYERQYQVSDWIMANGFDVVNTVGRYSVTLSARINSMGDGRVGQMVTGAFTWTVDSVTGGIQEGYGKGMNRIRRQTTGSVPDGGTAHAGQIVEFHQRPLVR
ncbi:hypothetical protein JX265_003465 [Neoarthrinium moseri]|uniref:Uncharacterized protein n=1 Tax=Neoarthrinium moseri TaxID=1658444 RepID=A0A9Q0APA6_9PEZI|nr:hypothetical protein JX266_004471 [Neoarthrinium moseri]KAI1877457.1 hypothetical protein JX265_003465 [Neoarthrinium moseri]